MILPLFKSYGLNIIEVPMKSDGMDNDILEKVLKEKRISFIYTMPNFHNPTGITTSQSHRERLLSLSEKFRVPVLEDGFEEEMKYYGKIVLPIKSMDKKHTVIYIGTFSKVLFPGIRIGWIAAEKKCIERIIALKRFGDLCSNSIVQSAMNDFCRKGLYDLHIKKMQRIYGRRMSKAITCIRKYIPAGEAEWTEPSGGYIIWFRIKSAKAGYEKYKEIFSKHNVVVSNGNMYFIKKPAYLCFRLCISTLNESEIEKGIYNLGKAIKEILKKEKGEII
jgi:DNA-binding transcriptional MocR family regulator